MRTAADASMPPQEAIRLLKEGNARFVRGEPQATRTNAAMRQEGSEKWQSPGLEGVQALDGARMLRESGPRPDVSKHFVGQEGSQSF